MSVVHPIGILTLSISRPKVCNTLTAGESGIQSIKTWTTTPVVESTMVPGVVLTIEGVAMGGTTRGRPTTEAFLNTSHMGTLESGWCVFTGVFRPTDSGIIDIRKDEETGAIKSRIQG